jgi:hypothetical protein
MRYNLTARTMARDLRLGTEHTEITEQNIAKVTRFRENGIEELERLAKRLVIDVETETVTVPEKKKVYPEPTVVFGKERSRYGLPSVSRRSLQGAKMQYKPTTW